MVVYEVECINCGKKFDRDHPSEPLPRHNHKEYSALPCNGSGLIGKLLGQKYLPD